jgi:hypothetical protein
MTVAKKKQLSPLVPSPQRAKDVPGREFGLRDVLNARLRILGLPPVVDKPREPEPKKAQTTDK